MLQRSRIILIGSLLAGIGWLAACSAGAAPREQALEATVAALQHQVATVSAPVIPATATLPAAPDWRKQFVGLMYPPFPQGWDSKAGAITFSNCRVPEPCPQEETYAVSEWQQTDQQRDAAEVLLVFEKLAGYDLDQKPIWRVLDVLAGSQVGGKHWLWGGCRAADSQQIDEEIVALYGIILDPSSPAWRANHLTGKLEPISTDGLVCVDENAVN